MLFVWIFLITTPKQVIYMSVGMRFKSVASLLVNMHEQVNLTQQVKKTCPGHRSPQNQKKYDVQLFFTSRK